MMTDDEAFQQATERLELTVKDISHKAAERGATQEIVDEILNER